MIQNPHVHQRQRIAQALRDEFIGVAGFGDARRMLGFVSECNHPLFGWVPAVHFRTLQVAPASVRGE
jgi:hypothetical protein